MADSPTSPFAPGDTPVSSAPVSPFAAGDVAHAAPSVSPFSAQDTPGATPSPSSPAAPGPMANPAPVTSPVPQGASPSVGPQVRGRFGMVNLDQQPVTAHDYAGAGANALDSATFGADRLLPAAVSGPLNKARTDLQASDPSAASAAQGVGGIMSPVNKVLGPLDSAVGSVSKFLPSAVTSSRVLQAAKTAAGGAGLGGAYSYGTSDNTGAARITDAEHGAEAGGLLAGASAAIPAIAGAARDTVNAAMSKIDPVILQSRANVADMVRQAQANNGGSAVSATQAANNVVQNLNTQLTAHARALAADPTLTQGQREGVKTIFPALNNQALSAKNTLGIDAAGNADGSAASALNQFHQLGIDPTKTAPLTDGLRDLDTLSQNKFLKQATGPLATLGGKIGHAIPAAALEAFGMAHGAPSLGLGGVIPGVPDIGGKMGATLGATADRAMGNATPPVLKQGDAAAAYLQSLGVPRAPLSLTTLQNANMARFQAPDAPAVDPAKAAFDKMVQQARIKQAMQSNAQMVKDQATTAQATTAQRGADVQAAFALSPEEALKQRLTNKYNTTMATEGLPASGNTPTIATAVENELGNQRATIAAKGGEVAPPEPAQAPQGVPPAPSSAPGATPVAPTTSPAPAAVPEAPVGQTSVPPGDRRQTLSDYLTHLAIAAPGGTELTPESIAQGIDAAAAAGDLTAAQAKFYKGSLNAPMDNSSGMHNPNLNTILAHSVALQPEAAPFGEPPLATGPKGRSGGTPNGGPNPVRNAYQASMAAAGYHANAGDSAKIAAAAGNVPLAAKIMEIAGQPEVATKQALADEFLGAETDPVKKAQAQLFLRGRLLTQGKS